MNPPLKECPPHFFSVAHEETVTLFAERLPSRGPPRVARGQRVGLLAGCLPRHPTPEGRRVEPRADPSFGMDSADRRETIPRDGSPTPNTRVPSSHQGRPPWPGDARWAARISESGVRGRGGNHGHDPDSLPQQWAVGMVGRRDRPRPLGAHVSGRAEAAVRDLRRPPRRVQPRRPDPALVAVLAGVLIDHVTRLPALTSWLPRGHTQGKGAFALPDGIAARAHGGRGPCPG